MAEITTVNVLRGLIEVRDGEGDGAGKPDSDQQRNHHNNAKDNGKRRQRHADKACPFAH